jgi:hypothetical protein
LTEYPDTAETEGHNACHSGQSHVDVYEVKNIGEKEKGFSIESLK